MAPGTVGSALALLVLWLLPSTTTARVVFLVVATVGGIAAAARVERMSGTKDPSIIVIDEVAGMTLSVLVLPLTPGVALVAFLLFRLFDVVKPFPANVSEALPGGFGVMVDDLIAGAYALLVVLGLRAWLGVPS